MRGRRIGIRIPRWGKNTTDKPSERTFKITGHVRNAGHHNSHGAIKVRIGKVIDRRQGSQNNVARIGRSDLHGIGLHPKCLIDADIHLPLDRIGYGICKDDRSRAGRRRRRSNRDCSTGSRQLPKGSITCIRKVSIACPCPKIKKRPCDRWHGGGGGGRCREGGYFWGKGI